MNSMPDFIPLSELTVVGYADRRNEGMYPCIVPPLFRMRDGETFLLPPFTIKAGKVWNPLVRKRQEIEALEAESSVTVFRVSFEARPEHELWLDETGEPKYEHQASVRKALDVIVLEAIRLAQEQLGRGELDSALRSSRKALNADDKMPESLAIQAAVAKNKGDRAGYKLFLKLAPKTVLPATFEALVDDYVKMIGVGPASAHHQPCSVVRGMALRSPGRALELASS